MGATQTADRRRPVTKFVLISTPRTGSTLLLLALADHPDVTMFGEIFNDDPAARRRASRARKPRRETICEERHPVRPHSPAPEANVEPYRDSDDGKSFLIDRVFSSAAGASAVGFKLFYDQARAAAPARSAWEYLAGDRSVHVVHLIRHNLLDNWLSLETALTTHEWFERRGTRSAARAVPKVTVSPHALRAYFETIVHRRESIRAEFCSHPLIELEYGRDICGSFAGTMDRVQSFLKIRRCPSVAALAKQARHRASDRILNYEELKSYFSSTAYTEFFD